MAYINDSEVLALERVRAKLRDNLRLQGIECADDETMDSLVGKVVNIQSANSLIDKTISGAVIDNEITSLRTSLFDGCGRLTSASFTKLTSIPSTCFQVCSSLKTFNAPLSISIGTSSFQSCTSLTEVSFPLVASIGQQAFNGCSSLTEVSFPLVASIGPSVFSGCSSLRYVSLPRNTGNQLGGISSRNLQIADLGQAQSFTGFSGGSSPYFDKLILRRENAITPLSATSIFNNTPFETGGGKLFTPTAQIPNYENGTNWSALGGLTVLSLTGSRFENLDWFNNCNSTCTLDGNEIKVLDNETVAIFKHTENISHVYENGVELSDSDTVAGKTLTTSV